MLLKRDELESALFCETDRAQRMRTPLSVMQIGIENDARGQPLSGEEFDHAVGEIVKRIAQLLRTYDSIGQLAKDTLFLILPGCIGNDARALADRLKAGAFGAPVSAAGSQIRLIACFGVASSGGRSPFIVMREATNALQHARRVGPGMIECFSTDEKADPVASFKM
jgi:two-component system, cell cycle response regulator